ncbi:MAG: tetratricopeptide repeat protein [Planctomycetota bacterium]|jgi:tetratricopeptide (TPR) repeat protein
MIDEAPPKPPEQTGRALFPPWLVLILFAAIGFIAYFNSLNVPFLFDDIVHIKNNVRATTTFKNIGLSARAWTYFTYLVNVKLHGMGWLPGWHLPNIVIHIMVAFLTYMILLELGRAGRIRLWRGTAEAAGLLVLVTPLATEAVTYITGRFTSQVHLFSLLTVYSLLRVRAGRKLWLIGVAAGTVLAAFSKEVGIAYPFMYAAATWLLFFPGDLAWVVRHKNPIVVLGLFLVFIVIAFFYFNPHMTANILKKYKIRDENVAYNVEYGSNGETDTAFGNTVKYLMSRTRTYPKMILLMLAPAPRFLNADHYIEWKNAADLMFRFGQLMLILNIVAVVLLRRREPLLAFGFLMILVPQLPYWLIPTIILVEYKLYACFMGVAILAGWVIGFLAARENKSAAYVAVSVISVLGILGITGVLVRNRTWQERLIFWKDSAEKSPNKARPNGNYARALLTIIMNPEHPRFPDTPEKVRSMYDDAERHLKIALEHAPRYGDGLIALGWIYMKKGDFVAARHLFEAARDIGVPFQPQFHLGQMAYRSDDFETAVKYLRQAASIRADYPEVHFALGISLIEIWLSDQGYYYLSLVPPENGTVRDAMRRFYMGRAMMDMRKYDDALGFILPLSREKQAARQPQVFIVLGEIYLLKKEFALAKEALIRAKEIRPNPDWRRDLDILVCERYLSKGTEKEAEILAQISGLMNAEPERYRKTAHMGLITARLRDFETVLSLGEKLVELDPDNVEGYLFQAGAYFLTGREAKAREVLAPLRDPHVMVPEYARKFIIRLFDD